MNHPLTRFVQGSAANVHTANISRSGNSLLLENHNRHPTRWLQGAGAKMPDPGATVAHRDSARRRSWSVQRNQRRASSNKSISRETQNRIQTGNRAPPLAEHYRSATAQFLRDLEQTRKSGTILSV